MESAYRIGIWNALKREVHETIEAEPQIAAFLTEVVLSRNSLEEALAHYLAEKLACSAMPQPVLYELLIECFDQASVALPLLKDLDAYLSRDSACTMYLQPFLFYKGFHALQLHRAANWLWHAGRCVTALLLQSLGSQVFSVDIHPAATMGEGIMIDHATGLVVGETAIVEDDVSLMQGVTLGGTGKASGLRHPIVSRGSLISAGSIVLGRITIGEGAKVGAGSVVLKNVSEHTTVVGIPARKVGMPKERFPALEMNQLVDEPESAEVEVSRDGL